MTLYQIPDWTVPLLSIAAKPATISESMISISKQSIGEGRGVYGWGVDELDS
jgi:hypothetical protein